MRPPFRGTARRTSSPPWRGADSGQARAGARNAPAVAAARQRQLERDVEAATAVRLPRQTSPPTVA